MPNIIIIVVNNKWSYTIDIPTINIYIYIFVRHVSTCLLPEQGITEIKCNKRDLIKTNNG